MPSTCFTSTARRSQGSLIPVTHGPGRHGALRRPPRGPDGRAVSERLPHGPRGIVCKRGDRPYRPGRSGDWLKLKCVGREEFVVVGYTPTSGSRVGIGGLQLGYYDRDVRRVVSSASLGRAFGALCVC